MATLYELSAELSDILDRLDECDDDAKVEELIDEAYAAGSNLRSKAENYVRFMRNMQTDIDVIDSEIQRLKGMKERREKAIDRLKYNMLHAMRDANLDKIETPLGNWSMRTAPWSVTIEDEDRVPERFKIPQPPKIDKKAILDEFKKTYEVIGGCDFAQREYVAFR